MKGGASTGKGAGENSKPMAVEGAGVKAVNAGPQKSFTITRLEIRYYVNRQQRALLGWSPVVAVSGRDRPITFSL